MSNMMRKKSVDIRTIIKTDAFKRGFFDYRASKPFDDMLNCHHVNTQLAYERGRAVAAAFPQAKWGDIRCGGGVRPAATFAIREMCKRNELI